MRRVFIAVLILVAGLFTIVFAYDYLSNFQSVTGLTQTYNISETASAIPEIVRKVLPSVVTISAEGTVETDLLPRPINIDRNIGSGFIVSEEGLIITNRHVVEDRDLDYKVIASDKREYEVINIFRDPLNDLAILKINQNDLDPLELGNSFTLQLGEPVLAVGTPLGEFTNTVTSGIISGLGRGIEAGSPFQGYVERLDNVIQTDAAISPGNSGGPLVNFSGQAVGVNTAIAAQGENLGFAIPINIAKKMFDQFIARGETFDQPFIGVRYQMIDEVTSSLNNFPEGAFIHEVITDSPANSADIKEGDIIVTFNNTNVRNSDEGNLTALIFQTKIGQTVAVEIWREGRLITKNIVIGSTQN